MEDIRKVVVTGTAGALGQAVARRFEDKGYQVLASEGAGLPQGFSGADVLVLAHVVDDEPNWLECDPAEWTRLRKCGLDSMFSLLQTYANARLAIEGQGSVIICTADGSHAEDGSDVLRSAISWGVRGLVRNASTTYARKGVRVNGVCIDGAPEDQVASLVEFLATGEHITGQTVPAAAGRALL